MGNLQEIEEEMKKEFRSFEESRKFAHSLNLKGQSDWAKYSKSGNRPGNIPASPRKTYPNDWKGWGDWLGTGIIANQNKIFLSFTDARTFAQSLNLKTVNEWEKYTKSGNKPSNIPSDPSHNYKNKGWSGMGDWLGTGIIANQNKIFLSFEDARKFVQALYLKSGTEWNKYSKSNQKPENIPTTPNETYKKEWISWGDYLGTGNIAHRYRQYRSFEDARKFVQALRLKSYKDWTEYCKSGNKPQDIPASPYVTYKNEWKEMGDWLGTGKTRDYRSFEESRKFAQSLNLKSIAEWTEYCKSGNKPPDVPANIPQIYKNKWKGYGDFLGTGNIANFQKEFRSFTKSREFAQALGLKGDKEWKEYIASGDKPDDIPSSPHVTYKNEWISLGDWLGTGNIANQNIQYRSFDEARKFIRTLGLKSSKEWQEYCASGNKPDDIPSNPGVTYSDWKRKKRKR
jgi:hypothetical protein